MYNREELIRPWPRILAALASVSLTSGGTLPAQVSERGRTPLTLEQVQQWAATGAPAVAAARARGTAAGARARSVTLWPDPTVSAGVMNRSLPRLGPMRPLDMTQLNATQMIPLGGRLRLAGVTADRDAEGVRAAARATMSDVRVAAALAFFDLYSAEGALTLVRENLHLLRSLGEGTRAQYASGRGRQADVLRADLAIGRMREEITRMETMRAVALAHLNGVLDRAIDSAVTAALPRMPEVIPPLDSLLGAAEAARPALQVGVVQVARAEAARASARRESWPDLEVGVQYGQRPGDMGTDRMGSVMVGAAVPLSGRQRQRRMVEEAAAMSEMARHELRGLRAETRERVTRARAEAAQALALLELYRTTLLPTAEATVESSRAAYRAGSVDLMMLLDSQMEVNRLRQGEVELRVVLGKALSELEAMTGMDLITRDDREGR